VSSLSQTVLREKLSRELERKRGRRGFRGFKAKLLFEADDLNVEVEVRYAKISSAEIDESLQIVAKSRSLGKIVQYKSLVESRKAWVTEDGEEVPSSDVQYFQKVGDDLIEVPPFDRTTVFEPERFIPSTRLDEYLIEKEYEVWGDNSSTLLRVAEWLRDNDKIAVFRISFGGFKEYYALLYPVFQDENFVLVMALTRMNKVFKHLMSVAEARAKVPVEKPKRRIQSVLKVRF